MIHPIGGEIIDCLIRKTVELILGARTYIEHAEFGECGKTDSPVQPVSRPQTIVPCRLTGVILISDLGMRHEVEFQFELRTRPFRRYIFPETMVVHLFPYSYIPLVETGGGDEHLLACIPPEGIIGMYAGQEITDALRPEEIMAEIERNLAIRLLRHILTAGESMFERERSRIDAGPCIRHIRMVDSRVRYIREYFLVRYTDTGLKQESVVLELIKQMEPSSSTSRRYLSRWHIADE